MSYLWLAFYESKKIRSGNFLAGFCLVFYFTFIMRLLLDFRVLEKEAFVIAECLDFLPWMMCFFVPLWVGNFRENGQELTYEVNFGLSRVKCLLTYCFVNLLYLSLPLLLTMFSMLMFSFLGDLDKQTLMCAYIGLTLVLANSLVFTILIYGVFKNKFASLLISFLLLLILNVGGRNGLDILSDLGLYTVAHLLAILTPSLHLESFFLGLLRGSDLCYFLISTGGIFLIQILVLPRRQLA